MQASWTKLKSGAWGIKTRGDAPKPGEAVTVTKANGETRTVTVARVIWRGEGVALCSIEGNDNSTRSNGSNGGSSGGRSSRAWAPCGYPGCNSNYCDECDGVGRGDRW